MPVSTVPFGYSVLFIGRPGCLARYTVICNLYDTVCTTPPLLRSVRTPESSHHGTIPRLSPAPQSPASPLCPQGHALRDLSAPQHHQMVHQMLSLRASCRFQVQAVVVLSLPCPRGVGSGKLQSANTRGVYSVEVSGVGSVLVWEALKRGACERTIWFSLTPGSSCLGSEQAAPGAACHQAPPRSYPPSPQLPPASRQEVPGQETPGQEVPGPRVQAAGGEREGRERGEMGGGVSPRAAQQPCT